MVSATANVLATIGTVCWCIQMVPQIIHNYRKKDTTGLNEMMVLLWCLCAPFFAVYFVAEGSSIPIQIQPHLFGFFCWIVYLQVMYYPPVKRSKKQIIIRGAGFILFQVIIEVAFIIPLKKVYNDGTTWPLLIFGIIASVLLALGLVPPYFELAKRNGRVVGINFVFLLTDLSGAVFSLASLAVDPENLDVMGCILYSICASMEVGIICSHLVWCMRFKWFNKNSDELKDLEVEGADSTSSSSLSESNENNKIVTYDSALDPELTRVEEIDLEKKSETIEQDIEPSKTLT